MTADFLAALLSANLAAGAAILIVLLLRRPARLIMGARIAYGLWLVVPLAGLAALLPARTVETLPVAGVPLHGMTSGIVETATVWAAGPVAPATHASTFDLPTVVAVIWAIGVVFWIGLTLLLQRRGVAGLGRVRRDETGVLRAANPDVGPALVGVFFPRLILPADFEARYEAREQAMILAHEAAHLTAGHTVINGLIAALRCLNWFNPLVHLAAVVAQLDQELACDAAVVARYPADRRTYGEALLKTQLATEPLPLGCYWPMRSPNLLKERITMLARATPNRFRRLAGLAALTALASGTSLAAWAVQPPAPATPQSAPLAPFERSVQSVVAPPAATVESVVRMAAAAASPAEPVQSQARPAPASPSSFGVSPIIDLDNDLYFRMDSYQVRADAVQLLDVLAERMARDPSIKVVISYHNADGPMDLYMDRLKGRRADTLTTELVSRGVARSRIEQVRPAARPPAPPQPAVTVTVAPAAPQPPSDRDGVISMLLGETANVSVPGGPTHNVAMRRSGIVDIVPESSSNFRLQSMAPGETEVVFYGADGRRLLRMTIEVVAKAASPS